MRWLLEANKIGAPVPRWVQEFPMVGARMADWWREHLGEPGSLGEWVQLLSGQHIGNIYRLALATTGNLLQLALTLLFMLITLFFFYKDGTRFGAQLDVVGERTLPERWQRFSRVVPATVSSTVTGMGLIALGEGLVLGVAYWVAGVPSPVLLGVVTGFMALVPGGAPLSFTLVSLYLVGAGHLAAGVGLFLWGSVELFIVDKTLRPHLVGGPVKLPFLPTFFGLVGGVKTMGLRRPVRRPGADGAAGGDLARVGAEHPRRAGAQFCTSRTGAPARAERCSQSNTESTVTVAMRPAMRSPSGWSSKATLALAMRPPRRCRVSTRSTLGV